MTPEMRQKLRSMLVNDEAYRQFPYVDTTGHLTIAIGRNLTDKGISFDEALLMLDNDINYFSSKLAAMVPCFNSLSDIRKCVMVNLCFNLGLQGFLQFKKMLSYLEEGNFDKAADEILDSKAGSQLPNRYERLAHIMRTDQL